MNTLFGQVFGSRYNQVDTVVALSAQYYNAAAQFVAEHIAHITQAVHISRLYFARQQFNAGYFFHLIQQTVYLPFRRFRMQLCNLFFQIFVLRSQLFYTADNIFFVGFQCFAQVCYQLFFLQGILISAHTGNCFNTAYPGSYCTFAYNFEQANLADIFQMSTATQFHTVVAYLYAAYHITVFFTEQRGKT